MRVADNFLSSVPVLSSLTKYLRAMCADGLTEESFEDGAAIVTQGEEADAFFIVKAGEVVCLQTVDGAESELVRPHAQLS